jgi:hypothetical protein
MNSYDWPIEFKSIYQAATECYAAGATSAAKLLGKSELAFLASIGCSAQELFDFIDDKARYGEPDYETVLLITGVRRDYFYLEQNGLSTGFQIDMDQLPAKSAEVDGIAWLPRLIEKARAKLRGEMPADLMYGCGGDRPFLRGVNVEPSEFLRLVWSAGDDQRKIINYVKQRQLAS